MTDQNDTRASAASSDSQNGTTEHSAPKAVYWCRKCGVPLISQTCDICGGTGRYCGVDLKPVFSEERSLFERFLRCSEVLPAEGRLPKELYINRGRVVWQGKRLFEFRVVAGEIVLKRGFSLSQDDYGCGNDDFVYRAVEANRSALAELEREALQFIDSALSEFQQAEPVVAFSGGKDSAVTAYLVSQVARPVLFFSDTTIEYPETYEYISSFAELFGLELVREEPDADFLTMCEQLGPPSRILRWCCSVFKGTLLSRFLNRLDHEVINFDGIRRRESNRRSKYERATKNPKVVKQITFRPIIDWASLEVWLYHFWRDLPLNPLYFKGFARVGCYACPNNTEYDDLLTSEYYPRLWFQWQERLIGFFDREYASEYDEVDQGQWLREGLWKKRMPHRSTEYSTVSRPCLEESGLSYEMSKPVDDQIVQFLKPLGKVQLFTVGNDKVGFSLTRPDWYHISSILNDNRLTTTFLNGKGYQSKLLIERQLRKWLNCVGCGACAGTCPVGTISIRAGSFQVADNLCTRCQECVRSNFTRQGCVALSYKNDSVRIREE